MTELIDNILNGTEIYFVAARMTAILILTWLAAKIVTLSGKIGKRTRLHIRFSRNIIAVMIYVAGIIMMLDQIPQFNNNALATLLTGSGIIALALSLAAQESLGNIINGMVISMSRPFEVGDRIHLVNGKITGYIEDMTMRHMVIRTFMNSRVIVPNSVVNKDMVENFNFLEKQADGFLDATITFDSDLDRAIEIMQDVVGAHPEFVDTRGPGQQDQPKVAVSVRELSIYGVELRARVTTSFIDTNFSACSEIRIQIKKAFDAEGIKFATRYIAD